ncbi:MAG: hypothetical protein ACD_63C00230G0003 [uncultured bacterium]|nr:MAG: hypothetical protein ACD_63C00230G0003 [uncultured bacterium]
MNTETKRHIDSARQILVGVVPNPSTQIDQITNALIYKFMDDMDQSVIKIGGKPNFFIGDLEKYAWVRIMDSRIGSQERMNLYAEALIKFSQAKQLPELFRDIFKQAMLPYRAPEVLDLFLKEINYFDYSHSEDLGDAFEYLLSVMGSQGDAGQFRTPRHIIEFIVDVVNPTKDDKVLDPACGTAGFLISAYKHISEQHDGKDDPKKIEKPLTPEQKKKLTNNFIGYDISPEMVRLSRVNMYLHNFKDPQIIAYNTLADEERWNDKFDVILANPPFMSPKGAGKPHSKFSIQSSRSEVLFVDYIINHLRPKGRAGIIVPEGIIFQSGKAHKELRKNLVNDGLYAVVSLPSGVFNPYAGVKTSILLFNNERAKISTEILFVKIEQDGFDLGATKRPISKNDLPNALEILNKWNTGEKVENKLAVYVEKTKIAENGDYNLSGDRYRVTTDYTNAKWPMVELGEVVEILDSKRKPITKSDRKAGQFPYYGATGILDYVHDYIFDERLVLIGEDGAKWGVGDKTAFIAEGKYWVNNHAHVVRPTKGKLIDTFLVSYLNNIDLSPFITGVTVPKLNQEKLRSIKIPLPPLEIQEQIVAELGGYAGIITGAKQITQNWKPKIDIDPEWDKVKLGEACEVFGGGTPSRTEEKYWGGNIPWLSARYFSDDHTIKGSEMITEIGLKNSSSKIAPKGSTILITRVSVGKFAIADQDYAINQDLTALVSKSKNLDPKYLWLISEIIAERVKNNAVGVGVTGVTRDFVVNQEIPLPPLATQKQIVEKIEAERALVESSKKLIEIYDQKTKEAIAKLWSE